MAHLSQAPPSPSPNGNTNELGCAVVNAAGTPPAAIPWRKRPKLTSEETEYLMGESAAIESDDRFWSLMSKFKFMHDELELLQNWPHFFASRDTCGEKLHAALLSVGIQLLLLGALLAGVSITPFVTIPQNLTAWRLKTYGALWMLVLMSNFATLGASALLLFHLLGCPPPLGWIWMCNIGVYLISTPLLLMSFSALLSFVTVIFSAWFLYGYKVGILATVVGGSTVGLGVVLAASIGSRHLKTLNTGKAVTDQPPLAAPSAQVNPQDNPLDQA